MAAVRGRPWTAAVLQRSRRACARGLAASRATRTRGGLLGLYTGGTLAHEARLLLEPLLGPVGGNSGARPAAPHRDPRSRRGRVHAGPPASDDRSRPRATRACARRAGTPTWACCSSISCWAAPLTRIRPASLAAAIREARATAAERPAARCVVVASIVGTEGDPQGLAAQRRRSRRPASSLALERPGRALRGARAQAGPCAAPPRARADERRERSSGNPCAWSTSDSSIFARELEARGRGRRARGLATARRRPGRRRAARPSRRRGQLTATAPRGRSRRPAARAGVRSCHALNSSGRSWRRTSSTEE